MMKREYFHCQQCGRCCREYLPKDASDEDIDRWEKEEQPVKTNRGRLVWLIDLIGGMKDEEGGWIYADIWKRSDGEMYSSCPFLKKFDRHRYICLLHDRGLKPYPCREYPFNEDGTIREEVAKICPEVRRLVALQEATI